MTNPDITPISIIESYELERRQELGILVPLHEGPGLEAVDCGDDRPLTDEQYRMRTQQFGHEVAPGRYYGAVSGLAVASLVSIAVTEGESSLRSFHDEFSAEGFVDYAATLSDRAYRYWHMDLNQHSADENEQHPVELGDHRTLDTDLGCKFITVLGGVVNLASLDIPVRDAKRIVTLTGQDGMPLDETIEGLRILQNVLPPHLSISRGPLHHAQTRSRLFTPVAIHTGKHAPNDQTELVMDLAGYRSNANRAVAAGQPSYHHTPDVMEDRLAQLMPEVRLDPEIITAAGLLLGSATRTALSGEEHPGALKVVVIPPEFGLAA